MRPAQFVAEGRRQLFAQAIRAQAFAFDAQLNALGLGMTGLDIVVPRTGRVVGRVFSEDLSQPDGLAQPVFGLVVELR